MKVKKSIVLGDSGINIRCMYQDKLGETCAKESTQWKNCTRSFDSMLQEVADEAFKLGMEQKDGH